MKRVRIGMLTPSSNTALEPLTSAMLSGLPEVSAHFEGRLAGTTGDERSRRMADLFWALVNSTEFKCSH